MAESVDNGFGNALFRLRNHRLVFTFVHMQSLYCKQLSLAANRLNGLKPKACRSRQRPTSAGIVLYNIEEAKAKLVGVKAPAEIVAAILPLGVARPNIMSALADLVCSEITAKAVADRYALAPSTIHYWAKRLGLPERQRGRRPSMQPNPKLQRILDIVRIEGIAGAARRVGISRQRVFQIVCRWEPHLKGRRIGAKVVKLKQPSRRPRRNIVVSFRISTDEWQKLLATECGGDRRQMSGFAKARAIVLGHLGKPDNGEPAPAAIAIPCASEQEEFVDIYNQKAA